MSSAYGYVASPKQPSGFLPPLCLDGLTIAHVSRHGENAVVKNKTLIGLLFDEFNAILREGRTYPQEGEMTLDDYLAYFFSHDVFLGFEGLPLDQILALGDVDKLKTVVVGAFYIKPNFPARSSFISNGGFVTLSHFRGKGRAGRLADAYLHFGPQLGYTASLFNLVYSTNKPSVALWEKRGFQRIATIPLGARIRSLGGEDEYVDSYMYYKAF